MEQRILNKSYWDSRKIYNVKDPKHYLPYQIVTSGSILYLYFYVQCLEQSLAQSEHSKIKIICAKCQTGGKLCNTIVATGIWVVRARAGEECCPEGLRFGLSLQSCLKEAQNLAKQRGRKNSI